MVLHLGSHKGVGTKKGIQQVVKSLEKAIIEEPSVKLLLENSAGTKNAIGSNFEEIGTILDNISDPKKVGVCFDTCHAFAAGYDLRTLSTVEKTHESFENHIGLKNLNIIHANDSKGKLNGRKDRQEHIGLGFIKEKGFIQISLFFMSIRNIDQSSAFKAI